MGTTTKKFTDFLDELGESNERVENFKTAIIGHIVVKIKDPNTRQVLWSCATDEWTDKRFEGLEVEQDMNVMAIIEELKKLMT